MDQFLVIIRGAPASGKTTIAKKMRDYEKKVVWLKVDNFKPWFEENATVAKQRDVDEVALASLAHLLDKKFSVVMEKIFYDPYIIPLAVQEAEKRGIKTRVFQIDCPLELLQERDRNRDGIKEKCRKPMGDELIAKICQQLEDTYYQEAIKLDTGKLSVDECVVEINKALTG